jgi:tetratricopeptide (TPR) repeat protein
MTKFCAECGSKLTDTYKFCPDCGAKIISSSEDEPADLNQSNQTNKTSDEIIDVLICDNCGEENSANNSVCEGCGVKLKRSISKTASQINNIESTEKKIQQKNRVAKNKNIKGKQHKQKTHKKSKPKKAEKQLDSKVIFMIYAAIGTVVIILLISFGVFDSNTTIVTNNNTGNDQSTNSGVDLRNIGLMNDLENQLQVDPNNQETLLRLANLKNDSGLFEEAINLYDRYLHIVPSDPDARIDMGVCMYNLGDFDNAILVMKKALEYKPDHQIGHLNLGIVNLTSGNIDEAKKWFQLAVDLGPTTEVGKRAKELLNSHNL